MDADIKASRGRPKSLNGAHKIQLLIEADVVRRMRHLAADAGVQVPNLYREAFDEYLARRDASGVLIEKK
jgi:hypothetical protein